MRILLDPGTLDGLNAGDVAMLRAAVLRFRRLQPDSRIDVLTLVPGDLASYCPGVDPVPDEGRLAWLAEQALFGKLRRRGPKPVGDSLAGATRALRLKWPSAFRGLLHAKMSLRGTSRKPLDRFLEALYGADVVVIGGQASLNDTFVARAGTLLSTLEAAMALRKHTALVGQAVGPIRDPALAARARTILPRVDVISLREERTGRPLVEEFGVEPGRIEITGDDALELSHGLAAGTRGSAIGVNVRVASYAGTQDAVLGRLREILVPAAQRLEAPLLPIPIAFHEGARDVSALRALLAGASPEEDGGATLRTPEAILAQVRRCRIVVTGAYHAAVFALGQGIPAVCLDASSYYHAKWNGLEDLFGEGCRVVSLEEPEWEGQLARAIDRAWTQADAVRDPLLAAAAKQVNAGRAAYARIAALPSRMVAA
jgi:polysaccharide pyruvyl transferase WcaK-like protein